MPRPSQGPVGGRSGARGRHRDAAGAPRRAAAASSSGRRAPSPRCGSWSRARDAARRRRAGRRDRRRSRRAPKLTAPQADRGSARPSTCAASSATPGRARRARSCIEGLRAARVPRLRLGRASRSSTTQGDLFVEKRAGKLVEPADGARRPDAPRRARPGPHPLGDPRPARTTSTPIPTWTARARSRSSTTGSSRTSRSSATASRRAATRLTLRDRHRGDRPPRRGGLRRRPRRRGPRGAAPGSRAPTPLAVMHRGEPDRLVGARKNVPLIVGLGDGETLPRLATSPRSWPTRAGSSSSRRATSPTSTAGGVVDHRRRRRARASAPSTTIDWTLEAAEKGGFEHFMLKEIHEQPRGAPPVASRAASAATAGSSVDGARPARATRSGAATGSSSSPAAAPPTPRWSARARSRTGRACRPASTVGSEFRYSPPPLDERTLVIAVTQSGETADTIAPDAARPRARLPDRRGHEHGRLGDHPRGRRGPVPPGRARRSRSRRRKTFVTQVTTLVMLAAAIAQRPRPPRPTTRERSSSTALRALPDAAPAGARADRARRADLARRYVNSRGFMFVGRGVDVPGGPRGRAEAQGGQLRPRRGLRGRRAEARPDLAARRRVPAGGRRDPLVDLRQAHQQRHGGPRPRRPRDRRRDRGRRRRSSASPTTSAGCPTRTRRCSPVLAIIPLQLFAYHVGRRARHGRRPAAQPGQVGHGRVGRWPADRRTTRRAGPARRVPPGTTELGIDIIKVDRIRDALAQVRARGSRTAS